MLNDPFPHEIIYTCNVEEIIKDATSSWFGFPTIIGYYEGKPSDSLIKDIYMFGKALDVATALEEIKTTCNVSLTLILASPYNKELELIKTRMKKQRCLIQHKKLHWFNNKPTTRFFKLRNGEDGMLYGSVTFFF